MEYTEDEYLMISGIQHFKFCRRQWALIHVEQQWAENVHTVTGELMHKKAHDPYLTEKRKDTRRHIPDSSGTGHSQTFGKTFPTLDRIGNA